MQSAFETVWLGCLGCLTRSVTHFLFIKTKLNPFFHFLSFSFTPSSATQFFRQEYYFRHGSWNTLKSFRHLFLSEMLQSFISICCNLDKPYQYCRQYWYGTMSRFTLLEKFLTKIFKFVVCNPCQSIPSLAIFVNLWFIIISLVFFYHTKLLFYLK